MSNTLGIIGVGLIGGSVGLAAGYSGWEVVGVDTPEVLDNATQSGAIHRASTGSILEHLWGVNADYLPSRVTGGEADGAPDQADPDDPQRVAHASPSAPMTRSFSSESPTVTRLQPG